LILAIAPQSAVLGIVTLVLALLLLLPPLLDLIVLLAERLQRRLGLGAIKIAIVELRSPQTRNRSLAISATAAVAVFACVTIEGSHLNLQRGLDRMFRGVSRVTDLWVVPREEQNLLSTTSFNGLPASNIDGLAGVKSVGEYRAGFLEYDNRRIWVLAPPSSAPSPLPASQLIAGSSALTNARLRAGGWATMSNALASEHHLHIGQTFVLPAPRETTLRLAAVTTNLGWPPGAMVLNGADYARAWESGDPSALNVMLAANASPTAVRAEIRQILGPRTGLTVETATHREQAQQAASRQGLARLTQIAILVLLAGVLATATVMGASIWQRRPRFARMKVQGYDTRTLWRALICESALLIGAGCLLGACMGIYGQLLLSHALVTVTGFPVIVSANALVAFGSFALMTMVAAACIAIPGYSAAGVGARP
jgi:putative ABC transport system permease protein